jgi:hypothetical protein
LDFFIGNDDSDLLIDNIVLEKKAMPESDVSGEWTIQSYDGEGNKGPRYMVDFTMEPDGTLKRRVDNYFFTGYVSGNQVEVLLHSKIYFNGTVNQTNDTITGVFKNYEADFTGNFLGVKGTMHESIAGSYDMYANYSTPYVRVQNEKDIIQINQDGDKLSILGKPGVTGKIDGVEITLHGDILPGEGSGGSQLFAGSVSGNSISGAISGTVVQKDASNEVFQQSITLGDFTLIKRND